MSAIEYSEVLRNLVLAGAAVLVLPFTVWRLKISDRLARIAEEGNITDRFSKAIEQLGSTKLDSGGKTVPNFEVRLGAIYALERIAHDSERDHWPIMNVLSAYVRENSECQDIEESSIASVEVRAIIDVLVRRRWTESEPYGLDLSGTNLGGCRLVNGKFSRADFSYSILDNLDMTGADLSGANFANANLRGSMMFEADLTDTDFTNTRLKLASWDGAKNPTYIGLAKD